MQDVDEARDVGLLFAVVWAIVVISVLTVFGLVKVGSHLFNVAPRLNNAGMAACAKQGGTPIFENFGKAYKACSVPGNGVKAEVK